MIKVKIIKINLYQNENRSHLIKNESNEEIDFASVVKNKIEYPKKYKVLLHNDDYTTMEFVIFILKTVFLKNQAEAEKITMDIHKSGIGICGIYTLEIAETKVQKVLRLSKENSHPLICTYEKE